MMQLIFEIVTLILHLFSFGRESNSLSHSFLSFHQFHADTQNVLCFALRVFGLIDNGKDIQSTLLAL